MEPETQVCIARDLELGEPAPRLLEASLERAYSLLAGLITAVRRTLKDPAVSEPELTPAYFEDPLDDS